MRTEGVNAVKDDAVFECGLMVGPLTEGEGRRREKVMSWIKERKIVMDYCRCVVFVGTRWSYLVDIWKH